MQMKVCIVVLAFIDDENVRVLAKDHIATQQASYFGM